MHVGCTKKSWIYLLYTDMYVHEIKQMPVVCAHVPSLTYKICSPIHTVLSVLQELKYSAVVESILGPCNQLCVASWTVLSFL
jgi:hypothetical protein